VSDAGDAGPGILVYRVLACQVPAGRPQPKKRREAGERAHANVFWADGRWHGQRLPPITAQ
jgi:hypothetical protein